jgi:stage II sporulation protein B
VDKPTKGNTIKIKLNGEYQPVKEEPIKTEPKIDSTPRVIKINSNLIDSDTISETAAAKEPIDESFDWIIPESSENDIEEFKIASTENSKKSSLPIITSFSTNMKKKPGRPFGNILISAVFAILIGTTLGFVMLKLVISGPTDKVGTGTVPTVVEETVNPENKAVSGKTSSATIDQQTTYVIQGGFYTSKDGAKETSAQLTSKGIPTQIIEMDDKHFIFIGTADSIQTAKSLSSQYKEKGAEGAFAKPLLLDEKKVSDVTEKEKSFLEAVPTIYQTLSTVTSSALLTKAISEESTKALEGIEEQLKESSLKNEQVKKLKAELTSANEKVKAFQKSKSAKSLSEAQQHLLNFLSVYSAM